MKITMFKHMVFSSMVVTLMGSGLSGSASARADGGLRAETSISHTALKVRETPRLGADVRSRAVSVKDLDLAVQADVETFYRRLGKAARDVCDRSERHDILLGPVFKKCVRQTLDAAVADTGSPAVSALHMALTHRAVDPDSAVASAH